MPVIINDLEVILEPPESAPATADGGARPEAAPEDVGTLLTPNTLERVEAHRRARAARIRGH